MTTRCAALPALHVASVFLTDPGKPSVDVFVGHIHRYGFVCDEDPANTFRPSLNVTVCALVKFEPSFATNPFTVTVSPILSEFRVQPFLINIAGGPSSTSQLMILPLWSFTSTKKRACGLIQSTFVTGPVIVLGLLRSYCAAKE